MRTEQRLDPVEPFVPLRPVPRRRLILKAVLAPLVWLVSLIVVSIVLRETIAIELGVLITLAVMAGSAVVLSLLRAGRNRQRVRYGDRR